MSEKNKYLIKAFDTLGLEVPEDIKNEKDLDDFIKNTENQVASLEDIVIRSKDIIAQAKRNIDTLIIVKHQIKVERYKELNPEKDVF